MRAGSVLIARADGMGEITVDADSGLEGEYENVYIVRRRRLTTARPAYMYLARLLPESGQMVMLVIDGTAATGMASEGD